jgi:hypothetical protein
MQGAHDPHNVTRPTHTAKMKTEAKVGPQVEGRKWEKWRLGAWRVSFRGVLS